MRMSKWCASRACSFIIRQAERFNLFESVAELVQRAISDFKRIRSKTSSNADLLAKLMCFRRSVMAVGSSGMGATSKETFKRSSS